MNESGILIRWIAADGQRISVDDEICELETDLANVTIPAWSKGILRHLAKVGDRIDRKSAIARIEPES